MREWIFKSTSTTDKRSFSVQLTETGNHVLEKFLPENFSIVNNLLGSLSNEEIRQLSNLFKKINDSTQKHTQEKEK